MRIIKTVGLILAFGLLVSSANAQEKKPELIVQTGHSDDVQSIAFSHDGKLMASGSNNTIKLWDISSGQEIATFSGFQSKVYSLAFSPDGKFLASGLDGGNVWFWEVSTGKAVASEKVSNSEGIIFTSTGKMFAGGGSGIVESLNLTNGKFGKQIEIPRHENERRLFPQFKILSFDAEGTGIWIYQNKKINLWDVKTAKVIKEITVPYEEPFAAYLENNKLIVAVYKKGEITLLEMESGQTLRTLKVCCDFYSEGNFFLSPNGKMIAGVYRNYKSPAESVSHGVNNVIEIYDIESGKSAKTFRGARYKF